MMKERKKLSDRRNFLGGLGCIGLGIASYLVDCALAPKEVDHLYWLSRGIYALGPTGIILTLPLLVIGLSVATSYGLKLLLKKEADPDRQRTTRGM